MTYASIQPGVYDLTIFQGDDQGNLFVWTDNAGTPINITGYTAAMMVRAQDYTTPPLLTLTTENGGIVLGTTDGTINLVMSNSQTSALDFVTGVWDIYLISPAAKRTRLLMGACILSRDVTR
jgi:hypothetical protein